MENVGELLEGKFTHHFRSLRAKLEAAGYEVASGVHFLNDFGLPQRRRRSLVVAAKRPLKARTLERLWRGYTVKAEATHVRQAIAHLPRLAAGETHVSDPMHVSPNFSEKGLRRLQLISHDGGSWPDLLQHPGGEELLIPSMRRHVARGRVGPHRDVYGRMAWDEPAPPIKRECAHTGNGRYAHPEQDRLCSVREMALLQGFPSEYQFVSSSLSNMYRHVGDAVPPLISYQIAWLCSWILGGTRPQLEDVLLPGTHLREDCIVPAEYQLVSSPKRSLFRVVSARNRGTGRGSH